MEKFPITFINRSGKSKTEIKVLLELEDKTGQLNGKVKKQVKSEEDGKPILKVEEVDFVDIFEYKDIGFTHMIIPYFDILITLAILIVAGYLVLNTSNIWFILGGIATAIYTLIDSYFKTIQILRSFSMVFKNNVRYDLIFKSIKDKEEAYLYIKNKIDNNQENQEE